LPHESGFASAANGSVARKMMLEDGLVAGDDRGESYGYDMFVIGASSSTLLDMQSIIKGTCPMLHVDCLFTII
jgi:hypothetical protein